MSKPNLYFVMNEKLIGALVERFLQRGHEYQQAARLAEKTIGEEDTLDLVVTMIGGPDESFPDDRIGEIADAVVSNRSTN